MGVQDTYRRFKKQLGEGQRENEYEVYLILPSRLTRGANTKTSANQIVPLYLAKSQDLPEIGHETIPVKFKGKTVVVAGERTHSETFTIQLWGGTSDEFHKLYEDVYAWERSLSDYDKSLNAVYDSADISRQGLLVVGQPITKNGNKEYVNVDALMGIQPKTFTRPSYNSENGEILSFEITFSYEMHDRLSSKDGNEALNTYANDESMKAILNHFNLTVDEVMNNIKESGKINLST